MPGTDEIESKERQKLSDGNGIAAERLRAEVRDVRCPATYEAAAENPKIDEKQQRPNQESIDKTFKATADDAIDHRIKGDRSYADNLFASAADGKPIVLTIGRSGDPETANALKKLEEAKKASGGKADYMFVDVDKVDKTSDIGKYVQKEILDKNFKTPLTMVVTQREGDKSKGEGAVVPEQTKQGRWWQGGNLEVPNIAKAVNDAAGEQKQIKVDRKIRDENDLLDELSRSHKEGGKEKPNYLDPARLRERMSGTDSHVVQHKLMEKAIDAADDEAAKAAQKALDARKAGNNQEFDKYAKEANVWSGLASKARVADGLTTLHMANEYADRTDNPADNNRAAFKAWKQGAQDLLIAADDYARQHKNDAPDKRFLADNKEFQKALSDLKLPGELEKMILESCKPNPEWIDALGANPTAEQRTAALDKALNEAIFATKQEAPQAVERPRPGENDYQYFGAPNTVRPIKPRRSGSLPMLDLV